MLIDHNNLVQKTNLRQNLSEVIERVYQGETIYISDRGVICAQISPFGDLSRSKKKEVKLFALQKELQDELKSTKVASTDTTAFIRKERNKLMK